jgi:hypothetical protein
VQLEAEVEGELQVVVAKRFLDGREERVGFRERLGEGVRRREGEKLGY